MDILSIAVIVVGAIIVLGTLYISIKNKGLREVAIILIVEAEKAFEYGKNSEKFNYVFENFYERLPIIFKLLLTKQNVINFIQMVFDEIKISLDYKNTDV
ncbi:MAG: hypothetical protein K0R72_1069 [Clostridia bacterium]|jgi:hypothetical protein|nr:hypothetical protein [Clostridia bacterium]